MHSLLLRQISMRSAIILKLPPMPADVAKVFQSYPEPIKTCLMDVRRLIFATAAETDGVGMLTETLKWGEPAYLTQISKSGSTIRLGRVLGKPEQCAIYFNCRTNLLDLFRSQFSDVLTLVGDRAIVLNPMRVLSEQPLQMCLAMALTYHSAKSPTRKAKRSARPL